MHTTVMPYLRVLFKEDIRFTIVAVTPENKLI